MTNARSRAKLADLELLGDVARRAAAYLHSAPNRRVAPAGSSVEALRELARPLPESSSEAQDVLALLDRVGSPATVVNAAGRFFGFVNGGAVPASVAASWMVTAWDQNSALRVMSPASAMFEEVALGWVRDLLGFPAGCEGALVTGATMANFAGLAAARHALLARAGWDVENDGLFGAPPVRVVVGDEVHVSLIKALGLLGLGRRRVHRIPVDGQGRMRADAVPALDGRTIVCIQAGNVNTGAFDPAKELCERAAEAGAWVHVDGAFGLWAACSPRYRHLVEGFGGADSWATDGHKWPNVGYDCGIAFVRRLDHIDDVTGDGSLPLHAVERIADRSRSQDGRAVHAAAVCAGRGPVTHECANGEYAAGAGRIVGKGEPQRPRSDDTRARAEPPRPAQ